MTTEPTYRALRRLRGSCAITTTSRHGYGRADVQYIGNGETIDVTIASDQADAWSRYAHNLEGLELIALRIIWHHLRHGYTLPQARRLVELIDMLRRDHCSAVIVHGSATVSVEGSKIGASVERDGGAWMTWADGTRTYDAARVAVA